MTSRVTGFAYGPTSSGLMNWHACTLDCGHMKYLTAGASWTSTDVRNYPGSEKIGDVVECDECKGIAAQLQRLAAIDVTTVHHARYRQQFGGRYTLYRIDKTSPSGFISIDSFQAVPQIDSLLSRMGISPISPTEPA